MRHTLGVSFLAVAACGGGSAAPDHDAAIAPDATPPAVGPLSVTVHDRVDATLVSGAHLLSYDPDGELHGRTTTDSLGSATLDVIEGGSLVVLDDIGSVWQILDVEPGDDILLGRTEPYCQPGEVAGTMNVTIPDVPGADGYVVWRGETDGTLTGPPGTFPLDITVCDGAAFPLMLEVQDSTGDRFAGGVFDFEEGGMITFGALAPIETFSLEVTGVPTTIDLLDMSVAVRLDEEVIFHSEAVLGPRSTAHRDLAHPRGFGDFVEARARLLISDDDSQEQRFAVHATSTATVESIDLEALAIPWIWVESHTGEVVEWTLTGGGAYDGTLIDLRYASPEVSNCVWTIVAPPDVTTARFPALPEDLPELAPGPTSTLVSAEVVASPLFDSYAELRAAPSRWLHPTRPGAHAAAPGDPLRVSSFIP